MRYQHARAPVALVVALAVTASMALVSGAAQRRSAASAASTAAAAEPRGEERQGEAAVPVVGTTANGREVTGKFVPLKFSKKNGKVLVRGLVQGVVHNADGSTSTFGVMRTMRVKSINGEPASGPRGCADRAACDILRLVLGPLDLDLLGLQVHLNRVVLDIVA